MESAVRNEEVLRIKYTVCVKGVSRGAPVQTFEEKLMTAADIHSLHSKFFHVVQEHIIGKYSKPEGKPVLEPRAQGFLQFNDWKDFIRMRSQKIFGLIY